MNHSYIFGWDELLLLPNLRSIKIVFSNMNSLFLAIFPNIKCYKTSISWNRYKIYFYGLINFLYEWKGQPRKFFFILKSYQKAHITQSGRMFCDFDVLLYKEIWLSVLLYEKNGSSNNHILRNFWNTLGSIPVNCNCFLCLQLDGFDQSYTSEENGVQYSFHCSLSFHRCWFEVIFKDPPLRSWRCNVK